MSNGDPVAWGKLLKEHGFATFVALLLLGTFVGWLPSPMLTTLTRLVNQMDTHTKDEQVRTYILRQICQNIALDKEQARKCLQDSP